MAAPIPRLMGYQPVSRAGVPQSPPRNPNIGPTTVLRPALIPAGTRVHCEGKHMPDDLAGAAERFKRNLSFGPWECDRCGDTGFGYAADGFSEEETEHCLTGCMGSLRAVGKVPAGPPVLAPIPAKLISD